MPPTEDENRGRTRPQSSTTGNNARRLRSADLFSGGRRVIIEHQGEEYCLRLTKNERLILNKL